MKIDHNLGLSIAKERFKIVLASVNHGPASAFAARSYNATGIFRFHRTGFRVESVKAVAVDDEPNKLGTIFRVNSYVELG